MRFSHWRTAALFAFTGFIMGGCGGDAINRPTAEELAAMQNAAPPVSEQPGMVKVRRKGANYDIEVVLDATDDNVYFAMDLPKYKKGEGGAEDEPDADEGGAEGERAKALSSKHVLYAQTYFYEDKHERALHEVNEALRHEPDSAVAHALKGSIYYKMGQIEEARIAWRKALELDDTLDNVRFMLKKIEK